MLLQNIILKRWAHFLWVTVLSVFCKTAWADDPPVGGATNLTFNSTTVQGNAIAYSFTKGDGARRIVICKAGSPVDAVPANGSDYNANQSFSLGDEIAADNFVILENSGSTTIVNATVSGLSPNTVYHFAVFEFNGTGLNTEYLTTPAEVLRGSFSTLTSPGTQASSLIINNANGHSADLSWTNGNGSGRVVVCRPGSPVSASPVDLAFYNISASQGYYSLTSSSNGDLGSGNRIVWRSQNQAANSFSLGFLEPGTTYYFKVFEFNGSTGPVYNTVNPAEGNFTTGEEPSTPATAFSFTPSCNAINLQFTEGDGARRLVVARKGSAVNFVPVNGQVYPAASSSVATAPDLGGENFLIQNTVNAYSGNAASANITGITHSEEWHFAVFDYNGNTAGNTFFNTTSLSGNISTLTAPTIGPGAVVIDNVTSNSFRVTLGTPGNGNGRMVMIKAGSTVDASLTDCDTYNNGQPFPNIDITECPEFATGNRCVYPNGNASPPNQFTVTHLSPGVTYYVKVYEFNGVYTNAVCNTIQAPEVTTTTSFYPATAASNLVSNPLSVEGNAVSLSVTPGDGTKRMMIVKRASSPTANPVDGSVYGFNRAYGTANTPAPANNILGNAADSNYIVWNGDEVSGSVNGLKPRTTYNARIIEYNGETAGDTWYANSLAYDATFSTAFPPANSAGINADQVTGHSARITLTAGNGRLRSVFIKEAGAVDIVPQDLVRYTGQRYLERSTDYGNGNYCITEGNNNLQYLAMQLKANTTYHVAVFEYNGLNAPVYKTNDPGVFTFTTLSMPTTQASFNTFTAIEGNSMTGNISRGNGGGYLVVAREGSPVNATLTSAAYTADPDFGEGSDLGDGNFVVQNVTNDISAPVFFNVRNLEAGKTYHFAIFEYNTSGTDYYYLTPGATANQATLSPPASNSANFIFNNITDNSVTVSWTNGSGQNRLLAVKAINPVTFTPQNYTAYNANVNFGVNASHAGDGNYVVYESTGSQVTVRGLLPSTTYHFALTDFNGNIGPVYFDGPPTTGSITTAAAPISLVQTSSDNLCTNAPFNVAYNIDAVFNPGNIFTAQLSDASGSFASPVTLGSQASTTDGNIVCNMPGATVPGANYLMRIVSSNPVQSSNAFPVNVVNCNTPDMTNGCVEYTFRNVTGTPWYTIGGANGMAMAINPNNQDIGDVTVSVHQSAAPFEVQPGRYFMSRYFTVGSTKSFASPVSIRLPFTTQELTDFNTADGTTDGVTATSSTLVVSKYDGPNEDCDPLNNEWQGNQEYIAPASNANLTDGFYIQLEVSSFSELGTEDQNTVLPLKLISFSAKSINEDRIELRWRTAEEENVKGFEVEWTEGNITGFIKQGFVAARNSGQPDDYFFYHPVTNNGKYYFRLKMIDRDGKYSYSPVIMIEINNATTGFAILPNPVKRGMSLQLRNLPRTGTITLADLLGRIISATTVNSNTVRLQIPNSITGGIYILRLTGDGQTIAKRIIIE